MKIEYCCEEMRDLACAGGYMKPTPANVMTLMGKPIHYCPFCGEGITVDTFQEVIVIKSDGAERIKVKI